MARDLTAEELAALRERLDMARRGAISDPTAQMAQVLAVLSAVVEALGESANLTLQARKRFDEASSR